MNDQRSDAMHAAAIAAIGTTQLTPAFQPIVHLHSGGVYGFEVLARWNSPTYGQVPPSTFIPMIQTMGGMEHMTSSLISTACQASRSWPGDFVLSFNISPSTLQRTGAVKNLISAIRDTGFLPARIHFEMTEAEIIVDEAAAERAVSLLRGCGAHVVVDDFGTGYSSLTRLHRYAFDALKIDASFVRCIEEDAGSRKIISATIALSQALELRSVAEGIEKQAQADYLRKLGCDYGQGWLFGHPMTADQALSWLEKRATHDTSEHGIHHTLYHQQYQLSSLYDTAPVGLCFMDRQRRYTAANAAFCTILGKSVDEIIGKRYMDVLAMDAANEVGRLFDAMMIDCSSSPFELRIPGLRYPGQSQTFLVYGQHVRDSEGILLGLSLVSLDITDFRAAQDGRVAQERILQKIAEYSPTVLWVADDAKSLTYISPYPGESSGTSLPQRIEAWFGRMLPAERQRLHADWSAWSADKGTFSTQFNICWPDGTWRLVRSEGRPFIENGKVTWYGSFTDISRGAHG